MGTDFVLLKRDLESGHSVELSLCEMSNRFTFCLTRVDAEDEPVPTECPEFPPITTEELIGVAVQLLEIAGEWTGEIAEAQAELTGRLNRPSLQWVIDAIGDGWAI